MKWRLLEFWLDEHIHNTSKGMGFDERGKDFSIL